MRIFRRRVRAKVAGVVVSIRVGDRMRISVQPHDPDQNADCYFVTDAKVKPGQRVRKGKVLGKV